MKRNFQENPDGDDNAMSNLGSGYTESKMSRMSEDGANLELRFIVPGKAAGVIIGRGGENVREVREKFEIKVNIPDSPGPERVLQVSGRSNVVMQALEYMLERTKECFPASEADVYVDGGRSRSRSKRPRSHRDEDGSGDRDMSDRSSGVDLRMLVHQSQAGGVIGRGGERIKELREQVTLKHLKIYQNTCPSSTDRVIQMVGEIPKVLHCVQTILDMIQMFPIRGSELQYDARNFDESQALSYGGWLSKNAYKAVQEYGASNYGAMSPGPAHGNSNSNSAIAAIAAARANMINQGTTPPPSRLISNALSGVPRQTSMMMMQPNMMAGGSRGRYGNNQMNFLGSPVMDQSMVSGPTKTTQVSVPNAYMGAIMGRAGCRIRSIREESGAEIRVHETEKGSSDRVIDITGNPTQIAYAQQLLKSCVLLYHDK